LKGISQTLIDFFSKVFRPKEEDGRVRCVFKETEERANSKRIQEQEDYQFLVTSNHSCFI
jgi:hypothetical protein